MLIEILEFGHNVNLNKDDLEYLKKYKFEEATANFKWFEKKANNKEKRDVRFSEYKSMAQNGLYLIRYYKKLQVVSKKMVAKNDFFEKYNVKIEGNLVNRFEYFNQKSDGSGLPNCPRR